MSEQPRSIPEGCSPPPPGLGKRFGAWVVPVIAIGLLSTSANCGRNWDMFSLGAQTTGGQGGSGGDLSDSGGETARGGSDVGGTEAGGVSSGGEEAGGAATGGESGAAASGGASTGGEAAGGAASSTGASGGNGVGGASGGSGGLPQPEPCTPSNCGGVCAQDGFCELRCNDGQCNSANVACNNSNVPCRIICGANACKLGATCESQFGCDIQCVGDKSCLNQIKVVSSRLGGRGGTVTCSGADTCSATVLCSGVSCEVTCSGEGSCQNGFDARATNLSNIRCLGKSSCGGDHICEGSACRLACDSAISPFNCTHTLWCCSPTDCPPPSNSPVDCPRSGALPPWP